jgi:hypothetical protein
MFAVEAFNVMIFPVVIFAKLALILANVASVIFAVWRFRIPTFALDANRVWSTLTPTFGLVKVHVEPV